MSHSASNFVSDRRMRTQYGKPVEFSWDETMRLSGEIRILEDDLHEAREALAALKDENRYLSSQLDAAYAEVGEPSV